MKQIIQTILAVTFLSSFAWAENAQPMPKKTCPHQRSAGILASTAASKTTNSSTNSTVKQSVVR